MPPGVTVTSIAAGNIHSLAITSTGALYAWGHNEGNEFGDGTGTDSAVPLLMTRPAAFVTSEIGTYGSNNISIVERVSQTVSFASTAPTDAFPGSLDYHDTVAATSGLQPIDVSIDRRRPSVCASSDPVVSFLAEGTCTLDASQGGNAFYVAASAQQSMTVGPKPVGASTIAALTAGDAHTCALTTDGAVKCWGQNGAGALGDGRSGGTASPWSTVDVGGMGSDVAAISAGFNHTCSLTTQGAAWCWGESANGQLGNGAPFSFGSHPQPTPVPVSGLSSGVIAIAAGDAEHVRGHGRRCREVLGRERQRRGRRRHDQLDLFAGRCHRVVVGRRRDQSRPRPHVRADDGRRGEVLGFPGTLASSATERHRQVDAGRRRRVVVGRRRDQCRGLAIVRGRCRTVA